MSGVIVNYNNNALTSMSSSGTKTLLTSGKYCEGDFEVVYSEPITSSLTITPTETAQTFNATGVYGYKPITVNAISSTYVGTGIAKKSSTDTTFAGTTGTFVAPVGYYSAAATRTITTQAAQTIYPSTADQTIASYRWLTGTQTIKSVTTSNLTAANIAEGVVVKVGDASNASRITQITGTHSGETSYTATIHYNGNATYCYVSHNNTKYYTNGNTISFKAGDTLTIYCRGSEVLINGDLVTLTNYSYNLELPSSNIDIYLSYTSSTVNDVAIDLPIFPSGVINLSAGSYNVYGYSKANVSPGTAQTPATMITTNPTFTLNSTTGIITASYAGSSYITPTISSGWVSSGISGKVSTTGTSTYNLTTQAAQTIYPSTANQTISSYRWLKGTQTIVGVTTSNLTASNIAEGVVVNVGDTADPSRITQITGTHTPVSTSKRYIGYITSTSGTGVWVYNNNDLYISSGIGTLFNFGDEITIVAEDSGGYGRSIYIDGSFVSNGGLYATNYTFTPSTNFDISWGNGGSVNISTYTIPTGTLNIEFNGDYNVYGYARASVNIGGGGFTADQIAMRTISGDISGSATSISSYAFYNCYSLTTANFPNATSIGSYAFYNCYSLTTANFPSVITIGNSVFMSCHSLTTISFPNVTSVGSGAFYYCTLLTTASFSNATSIGSYAFASCSSLTTTNFPSVTSIGSYAFANCKQLSTISFPRAIALGSYTFFNCHSLTNVSLPIVTSIYTGAFACCSNLTTISLPKGKLIYPSAFSGCWRLLSLYLLNSSVVTLSGINAFINTPISTQTAYTGGVYGSIFVPSSLYNSYITATNWSTYSARMVSV